MGGCKLFVNLVPTWHHRHDLSAKRQRPELLELWVDHIHQINLFVLLQHLELSTRYFMNQNVLSNDFGPILLHIVEVNVDLGGVGDV